MLVNLDVWLVVMCYYWVLVMIYLDLFQMGFLDFILSFGEFVFEDRLVLCWVVGLLIEFVDVFEVEYCQLCLEWVVLVGVWIEGSVVDNWVSLVELVVLVEIVGFQVFEGFIQCCDKFDLLIYIGLGKVVEFCEVIVVIGVDIVICDGELLLVQLIVLEKVVQVKVIDCIVLIFDIFVQYVISREGKVQVLLVQMEYMLLWLCGWGELMLWQVGGCVGDSGGGVGLCGFGEIKIEID